MQSNIYTICDGFFDDPVEERRKALHADFKNVQHNNIEYPNVAVVEDALHADRVAEYLGLRGKMDGPGFCYYRCNLESQEEKTYIHSDSRIGVFTAVAALTPRSLCSGGTAFWRHKKYGWESQPNASQVKAAGITKQEELWHEIYEDGFDESKWDLLDVASMAWNRAIIFSSLRFHSRYPQVSFGKTIETGRLNKVFFLNPAWKLQVRNFVEAWDYEEIAGWWREHRWPVLPIDHLSKVGFVAEDEEHKYCAAWVYRTDSAFGLLEWVVSNPNAPMKKRSLALDRMLQRIAHYQAEVGIKTLFINCEDNGLLRRLKEIGFVVGDRGMINLTRRLP